MGGGDRTRRSPDERTVHSVTIAMIHSATSASGTDIGEDGLQLPDGRKLHHVKLVAAARSVENFSTSCIYNLEDGTGLMEVKQWAGNNNGDCQALQDLRQECSKENIYLACTGQIKDYDGKKMILADSVRPIANGNELTYHMLEVVYEAEKAKRQSMFVSNLPQQQQQQGIGFGGSSIGGGGGVPLHHTHTNGGVRDGVLMFVKQEGEKTEEGANVQYCVQHFRGQFHETEIRKAIDDLAAEGHIYSTIDEHFYKFAM